MVDYYTGLEGPGLWLKLGPFGGYTVARDCATIWVEFRDDEFPIVGVVAEPDAVAGQKPVGVVGEEELAIGRGW